MLTYALLAGYVVIAGWFFWVGTGNQERGHSPAERHRGPAVAGRGRACASFRGVVRRRRHRTRGRMIEGTPRGQFEKRT
jgi:hypothetical protein